MSVLDPPESIYRALSTVALPFADGMRVSDALVDCQFEDAKLSLRLAVGYPLSAVAETLEHELRQALGPQVTQLELAIDWQAPDASVGSNKASVAGVKNIIAVASGKGGVGKSTTSVNLALALAASGASVGMLDADIYGPSQALMLGIADKRPQMYQANIMEPIPALGGVKALSMGNLVTEDTPMVWRGPMVAGAFQQLLRNTHWDDIDYLIVDMPPGTGDVQLTLSQTVPVSGSVIVTTPQDIALLDAMKGIEMFRKVDVPILGVVENMSTHKCSNCGHVEAVFGEHGGETLAQKYGVKLLGRLPLQLSIREQTDRGMPPVVAEPTSEISLLYRDIALRVAAQLWVLSRQGNKGPSISITDD